MMKKHKLAGPEGRRSSFNDSASSMPGYTICGGCGEVIYRPKIKHCSPFCARLEAGMRRARHRRLPQMFDEGLTGDSREIWRREHASV